MAIHVQPGLCWTWSGTPKTGFLKTRLIYLATEALYGPRDFSAPFGNGSGTCLFAGDLLLQFGNFHLSKRKFNMFRGLKGSKIHKMDVFLQSYGDP